MCEHIETMVHGFVVSALAFVTANVDHIIVHHASNVATMICSIQNLKKWHIVVLTRLT